MKFVINPEYSHHVQTQIAQVRECLKNASV